VGFESDAGTTMANDDCGRLKQYGGESREERQEDCVHLPLVVCSSHRQHGHCPKELECTVCAVPSVRRRPHICLDLLTLADGAYGFGGSSRGDVYPEGEDVGAERQVCGGHGVAGGEHCFKLHTVIKRNRQKEEDAAVPHHGMADPMVGRQLEAEPGVGRDDGLPCLVCRGRCEPHKRKRGERKHTTKSILRWKMHVSRRRLC